VHSVVTDLKKNFMKHKLPYPTTEGYCLSRAVSDSLTGVDGPALMSEREPHLKIKKQFGKFASPAGRNQVCYVPFDYFNRAYAKDRLETMTRADLGGTTSSVFLSIRPEYSGALIAHSQVYKAGATVVEGCEGQIFLVGGTALPQPAFSTLADGTTQMTISNPTFSGGTIGAISQIYLPLRMSTRINVSKQLLLQGNGMFEPILRDIVSRGMSSMIDNLALFGSGTSGQPYGAFSTVTPVNLAGTPMTWANFQAYRTTVLLTDLDPDSFGVIVSPAMLNYLDQTQAYSGASFSIWEKIKDGSPDRVFVGNEINTSTAMSGTTTQTGTLNATTSVTALTSTANLYVGMPVSGTNIPAGTTIAQVNSATSITLSAAATGSGSVTLTFTAAKGMFLGLWRFLNIMLWGDGVEISFDPYSAADTNQMVVRATVLANIGITWPAAFAAVYQN
jgi:hypothetical protein